MRYALLLGACLLMLGCGSNTPSSPTPVPTPAPAPAPAPPPVPFQGAWIGQWTKQQCSETGSGAAGQCAAWPTGGGFNLTVTQSGQAVQGTLQLGLLQLAVTGPIDSTGTLTLTGSGRQSGATVNLTQWRTSISGNLMAGSFIYAVLPDDLRNGSLTVTAGLQSVVKQ